MRPSTDRRIEVIDSITEEVFLTVAEAQAADMDAAITAAREAFDQGPWPRMTHAARAAYLTAFGLGLEKRAADICGIWPHESGVLRTHAQAMVDAAVSGFNEYAALGDEFPFEEPVTPAAGEFGLLIREPVGVVGAIIPWNGPIGLIVHKVAPALLAGCTVVLKSAPEAPVEGNIVAEIAAEIGLPPGVLNVVAAEREVSELLVRDPRVDKITFTGSTAAGRRIASLCGDRIARYTLELGGKSAAVILDDYDVGSAAETIAGMECLVSGQVCSSLTRIVVTRSRHDQMLEALASAFASVRVGDPFDPESGMGPLVSSRQRDRVEGYIAAGIAEGAILATGGRRPAHLDRGFYVEPTVFGNVDNSSRIAQEEIFGPVLAVIAAEDEADAVRMANDTIYGLNASVFTDDVDRAYAVARQLRSGTVGHNSFQSDFTIGFGGFKQSGIGREGGPEGLRAFTEAKAVILNSAPLRYQS
ncbi:aldehyde dehydrogenase [Nocardia jiangxiensis]|uniref:aldehyde dehydrogenase n=1 Tax=Nocardia jiangxiensis TaxID=282685 RepID=UPI00031BC4A2|nr:aldehyde dehydrogenase [Nocardia jiangxiensis]